MIRDGKIIRINKLSLDIFAITIVINSSNGKVYLGFSGSNNETVLKKYGEFNAINNALFDGASITDLCLYSINISNNVYWAPCLNCQSLYSSYVTFIK